MRDATSTDTSESGSGVGCGRTRVLAVARPHSPLGCRSWHQIQSFDDLASLTSQLGHASVYGSTSLGTVVSAIGRVRGLRSARRCRRQWRVGLWVGLRTGVNRVLRPGGGGGRSGVAAIGRARRLQLLQAGGLRDSDYLLGAKSRDRRACVVLLSFTTRLLLDLTIDRRACRHTSGVLQGTQDTDVIRDSCLVAVARRETERPASRAIDQVAGLSRRGVEVGAVATS